jgi:hypothetical protein
MRTLLGLLLAAWALAAQDPAGLYVLRGVPETASELELKSGGAFEFSMIYGAGDFWGAGSWKQEGNTIVLHSTGPQLEPFRFLKSDAGSDARLFKVWVKTPEGHDVPHVEVSINGKKSRTSERGPALFEAVPGPLEARLNLIVFNVESKPFALNAAHREFHFEVNPRAVTELRFDNDRLEIDGAALVLRKGGGRPMRYVKR